MRLLIAGVPGTGKTTFAKWLEREHGYVRCSSDELQQEFPRCVETNLAINVDLVIDWGFVASDPGFDYDFEVVTGMIRDLSVDAWWFDGDRDAARQSFIARGTVPILALDIQMRGIRQHWTEIEEAFKDRIVYVVSAGPTHLAPSETFRLMREAGMRSSQHDEVIVCVRVARCWGRSTSRGANKVGLTAPCRDRRLGRLSERRQLNNTPR